MSSFRCAILVMSSERSSIWILAVSVGIAGGGLLGGDGGGGGGDGGGGRGRGGSGGGGRGGGGMDMESVDVWCYSSFVRRG